MADTIENFDSVFSLNQKVVIQSGFYKGFDGRITAYDKKTNKYDVEILMDNNIKRHVFCGVDELKLKKGFLGF